MNININIIRDKLIKKQIKNNAVVVLVLDIIFYIILCFFKKNNMSFVLGLILGSSYSVLNFIFIAISTERLVLISSQTNKIKTRAVFYYYIRYFLMAIVIIIAMKINKINNLAFLVSLFFSKIAIFFQAFLE
ncbi:MAG: ATP synthase subunit I [Oscillospiraceae bacterium]|nr:ATP synthase subunit I [Oscillospiraceae bacterium]